MINVDLSNVQAAGEYDNLRPGGYICAIIKVENDPVKEYIKIYYDIAEGKYKNYWTNAEKGMGFWGGIFYRSYKDSALPFFKAFTEAVEHSNSRYQWDGDEKGLECKYIGLVLGEEEYKNKNGEIKTRLYVHRIKAVEDIRCGDFKFPPMKKLEIKEPVFSAPIDADDDSDFPF